MPSGAGWVGSRQLLKRLRNVMAGAGSAQRRLDQIVRIIAADMVAEVCSCYVLRAGAVLELFATEGLKPEAVHQTRLRVGEGLVGDIAAHARALALADAQSHPNFAYRPETGEEIYQSLMGVPIIGAGRVLGVLVVQNRTQRNYADEEIEALETIAMVLAELLAGGQLIDPSEPLATDPAAGMQLRLEGVRLSGGLAVGHAVLHRPRISIARMIAEDPQAELARVREAVAGMRSALDAMLAAPDVSAGGEHRDVLEAYRMFAEDRGWLGRIREAVLTGLTAEAAVQKVLNDTRVRMGQITDPYLRERLLDLEDLNNRLLLHLTGTIVTAATALPNDVVLIARSMGPAELLDYDRSRLRALVMEEGSATAHVAIVARALDIPVLGRACGVLDKVEPGDQVVVDADNAQLFLRPGEDVLDSFDQSMRARDTARRYYVRLMDLPAVTPDGVAVSLNLNAGLLIDMPNLAVVGADGVGLYRTEIAFMVRPSYPDVPTQIELYCRILELAQGKPVTFRTLDVGADKKLPYFNHEFDENPALGWRALRIGLDRPAMLRQQIRALLTAAAGQRLRIMFPMVAEVAEFDAARALVDVELERAHRRGTQPPERLELGAMVEVPALAWQLDQLLPRVDFLSIGSNDLLQFLFASDRGNPRLAERYDPLAPVVLRILADLVRRAAQRRVPVTLCGEMAGRPLQAMALIGIGYRSLSMPAAAIGPIKAMIRSLPATSLAAYLATLLDRADHSLGDRLRAFARDHDVAL
ncbi:MAG: phosphoenolpyruvate--protein phosphotransferase [Alphaproteobacteria bacterium]|nr:phosphoenolpyruvate--protein phosphotransferase [Alphaproteobacteria bacterium]